MERPDDSLAPEQDAAADQAAADAPPASEADTPPESEEERTARERAEYLELAQRTRAEFDNYRKRVAKESAEALERGRAELARELIPVIDNLERALEAGASATDPQALAKGVELVHGELTGVLGRAGVEAYDPRGESFDPSWHEALQTRVEEGTKPGIVVETLDPGYRLDGQVLRAARVVVSE